MNEASSIDVGPFTPQELDHVCESLKGLGVEFEVLKDEETERLENRPDFMNVVNKVEFRTETYLAQIFYLRVAKEAFGKHKDIFAEYGMATASGEKNNENPDELVTDMSVTHEKAVASARLRHWIAGALLVYVLLGVLWLVKDIIF